MRARRDVLGAGGIIAGMAVVASAHVAGGGTLGIFLQPTALLVVFAGTAAALIVSFPRQVLRRAIAAAIAALLRQPVPPAALVPFFLQLSQKARRLGLTSIEPEVDAKNDPFVARALTLATSGQPAEVTRQMLEIDARASADRDEELIEVFESAAGYAPTLGIVGAVLGLMNVMRALSTAGGAGVGLGIAAAFVATIYGVGASNLIFLPIATRLRVRARNEALRRELTIDGVLALHDRLHPSVLEERLVGYVRPTPSSTREVPAA